MQSRIQAIPTTYTGVQMRSRMEANTAALLDAAGIRWMYEAEGYDLDGIWYLPDFYLPELDAFLEVKGVMGGKDLEKVKRLALASGKQVYVLQDARPNRHGHLILDWVKVMNRYDPATKKHLPHAEIMQRSATIVLRPDKTSGFARFWNNFFCQDPHYDRALVFAQDGELRFRTDRTVRPPKVFLGGRIGRWRRELGVPDVESDPDADDLRLSRRAFLTVAGCQLEYIGPVLTTSKGARGYDRTYDNHGCDISRSMADVFKSCRARIDEADFCFFWFDDLEAFGALVEVGIANAFHPEATYVGFSKAVFAPEPPEPSADLTADTTFGDEPELVEDAEDRDPASMWAGMKARAVGRELWFAGCAATFSSMSDDPVDALADALRRYYSRPKRLSELT